MQDGIDEDTEVERYELRQPGKYQFAPDRRCFVQSVGGVGVLFTVAAQAPQVAVGQRRRARRAEPLGDRFQLDVDGSITVFTSKVEVGQGSRTQISQAVAEELGIPIDQVKVVMADSAQCPDDGGTAGSRTTPSTVPRIRNACVALRVSLMQLAAGALTVAESEVQWESGGFENATGGRITLSELVKSQQFKDVLQTAPAADLPVKPVGEWSVLGESVPKIGGRDVVTGAHTFPSDIQRPGMLYGKVLRPPAYGSVLETLDSQTVEEWGDVTVVQENGFVGCVAANSYRARQACEALAENARWSEGTQSTHATLFSDLKRNADNEAAKWDSVRRRQEAERRVNTEYVVSNDFHISYVQHAPMEPRAAVAEWNAGALTVWTGTQQPARVHSELCRSLRIDESQVRVVVPDTGGGFGGKHTGEAAVEAARLARAVGKPVSLRWTREEEFTWAYFRPAGLIEADAGVDRDGNLTYWRFLNYNSGGSALESPYKIRATQEQFIGTEAPLRQGSYRALASTANTFARECMMDELAGRVGIDPLDFRLHNLPDGRLKDVLQAVADAFQWRSRVRSGADGSDAADQPRNRGFGLACGTEKGSFVAACAEVEVRDSQIVVKHICQAFECGAIHNPRNLQAQNEGSIVMGLGAALTEKVEFEEGRITTDNFSSYLVPRMWDLPKLDVVLVDRPDLPSVGGSETPIIAVAPAIANAVSNAGFEHSRSMPLEIRS